MNQSALWPLAAVVLIFAVLLAGCGGDKGQSASQQTSVSSEPAQPAAAQAVAQSELLPVGTLAPDFKARDEKGNLVSLEDFRGKKNVVLVFYPKDNTPVCTSQLCAIRDDWSKFQAKDAAVFGVNPADAEAHTKFSAKNHFPFPILVDEGKAIAKAYHCGGALMISRTVYGIGKDGKIVFSQRGKPDTETVLKAFE